MTTMENRTGLSACPFCGAHPEIIERPSSIDKDGYFAAVMCYCGGHSACAHKMATAPTAAEANAKARAAWNCRSSLDKIGAA
jgi:Lar family restriction alleviation protein